MKAIILTVLMLIFTSAQADMSDWTNEQKGWYAAGVIFIVTDWATTRDLSRRYHEGYHEVNPILGRQPSTRQVDQYFALSLLTHYLIADHLSSKNRTIYLKVVTVGQAAVTAHNLNIGLKIKF
jgi:hypothetical protein